MPPTVSAPQQIGRGDGGFAAATLLSREQQALMEPSAFPGLLTNAELRAAYAEAKGLAAMLGTTAVVDSGLTVAGGALGIMSRTMPDH